MPISRRVFEHPENALEELVLEVLRLAPDSAYTLEEIVGELLDGGFAVADVDVQTALTNLLARARVDRTVLFDRAYYSYHRSIGFRPS